MTIINVSPDRHIQLGYEGEDRVTVLRFRYGAEWLENGEGIFHIRVRRHGEHTAYNAALVADDAENNFLLMTVTNTELSVKGSGEMQVVYSGADFVKKSPIYSYNVSRAVDEAVDPPAEDVYTQIIESLSDLQTDVQGLADAVDDIGDISLLTTTAKTDLVSAINEVNAKDVVVDDALSATSTNPVQNKVLTAWSTSAESAIASAQTAIQGKADIQTVSALADAVNGLDSDVKVLQTGKADTATVTALSGTVSSLQTAVQGKADTTTVNALSNRVSVVETDKATHEDVSEVQASVNQLGQVAQQYMEQTETRLADLEDYKVDKSYVDTQLADKASTQTVSDLADDVSDLQTGLASKVDDVWLDGRSVIANGVARITTGNGIMSSGNQIKANTATENGIKGGTSVETVLNPARQHYSAFYGLAKAAGHDEKNSTLPVGTYSEEAKIAIQKMLGIYEAPWELIREDYFTNETEADHIITTDANGDAFELTDLIILFETPKQATVASKGYYGHIWCYAEDNNTYNASFECGSWTQQANGSAYACGGIIENKGGISETTIITSAAGGQRTAVQKRLRYIGTNDQASAFIFPAITFKKINIKAVTGTGHYILYGKRKWQ